MVLLGGELWQAVIDWPRLFALVDRRIEIDEVPAGLAGSLHEDLDIALTVEAAGIVTVAIVVHHCVDIGGFAPAHAFKMNLERGLDRPAGDTERQRGRRNPECSDLAISSAAVRPKPVGAAKIIGRLEPELHVACSIRLRLGDRARALLPAAGADRAIAAATGHPRPHGTDLSVGADTVAGDGRPVE